jgi:Methyltransferase domain
VPDATATAACMSAARDISTVLVPIAAGLRRDRTTAAAVLRVLVPIAESGASLMTRDLPQELVSGAGRVAAPIASVVAVGEPYWRGAAEDEAMQEEHRFLWRALLDTIDMDLTGSRVLDAGCNRGGFLRLLVDECGISDGYGYDPASGAIDDARRLAGQRPLTFETAATVPAGWAEFEAAFSHEVLYLLPDLASHAQATFAALEPGAPYFAVIGVHAGSRLMSAWHDSVASELGLPRLYDLDEVVEVFDGAGFEVSVARLKVRFVPVSARRGGHEHRRGLMDWLEYYGRDKVLFRFTRPSQR